jgi:hypothetical protein
MEDMPARRININWRGSADVAQRRDLAPPAGVLRCRTGDADCTVASVLGRRHRKAATGSVSHY